MVRFRKNEGRARYQKKKKVRGGQDEKKRKTIRCRR